MFRPQSSSFVVLFLSFLNFHDGLFFGGSSLGFSRFVPEVQDTIHRKIQFTFESSTFLAWSLQDFPRIFDGG
jgi:hypothetical protein